VGKSSILTRFNENKFFENHIATIGLNHASKTMLIDNLKIKLNIWDTAGQDKFRNLTRSYYRNAQGAMVAFSINSLESYYSVSNVYESLRKLDRRAHSEYRRQNPFHSHGNKERPLKLEGDINRGS